MGNVVEYSPSSDVFSLYLYKVEIYSMEKQGQRLEVDEDCHEVVNLEDRMSESRFGLDSFSQGLRLLRQK